MDFYDLPENVKSELISKKTIIIVGVVCLIILIPLLSLLFSRREVAPSSSNITQSTQKTPTPSPKPTEAPFTTYTKPTLEKKEKYNIYLLGDSMTHAFGPRGGKFTEMLSYAYPNIFFEVSNYAEANQSILLLPKRLNESVRADHDILLTPVMQGDPDVIIIESFGYNPLSQLGQTQGLKTQEEILTEVMTTLTRKFPNTVIMFLAVIAPDKLTYAQAVTGSDADGRWLQAEERIEYITNHIEYAKAHNIPLINAYQASLDEEGDGDTRYINPVDDIHPSEVGLSLMADVMTRRIIEENIFQHAK